MSWFRGDRGQGFASRLFKKAAPLEAVQPGTTFRFVHADHLEETAQVLSVNQDSFGIPHVHFKVEFRRTHKNIFDGGARMLALRSFADRYREQVVTSA